MKLFLEVLKVFALHSAMSEPCSVRAREKTVETVDWCPRKLRFQLGEKNRFEGACVCGNRCKGGEIRKSLKNRFYACQFSHKTRKDAMATAIEGRTHKKHSLILKLHRIIISFLLFTARSPKVWPLLIYSHSFVQILSNQKPARNCPRLLFG